MSELRNAARKPLRKALKYGMIGPGSTVLEKFQAARDAGFEGIELDSPGPTSADDVLAAKAATGIEVPGVVDSAHWRDTLGDADVQVRARGRAALEQAIRDCAAWGGSSVLLVPAVVRKNIGYADAYTRSQTEIRTVLPLARELGIRISFENVWNNFLLSPVEAARYVDEIGPDVVGWHFDVGNVVNFGWPEHWIRTLGPRITRLDVKEFSRAKRDAEGLWKGFNVELGEGDCDWPAVMRALADIGYQGWACAEVSGGDADRLAFLATRMDAILTMP
jgi:hexulose-6-phosphate isomerase